MVGPMTEEFAFRSCMAPLLLLQARACSPPHAFLFMELLQCMGPVLALVWLTRLCTLLCLPGILKGCNCAGLAALLWHGTPAPPVRVHCAPGVRAGSSPSRGELLSPLSLLVPTRHGPLDHPSRDMGPACNAVAQPERFGCGRSSSSSSSQQPLAGTQHLSSFARATLQVLWQSTPSATAWASPDLARCLRTRLQG